MALPEVSYEELVERLIRACGERDALRTTLYELAEAEGEDRSLVSLVAIWRAKAASEMARAEATGTRCALAERALRGLLAGKRNQADIQAWQQAVEDAA